MSNFIVRFGLLFLVFASLLLPQSEKSAGWTYADSFRIKFLDSYGGPVPFRVKEFRDALGDGPDRSSEFHGGQLSHLASGKYRYQLVPEDRLRYLPAEGTVNVEVEQPDFGQVSLLVVEAKFNWNAVHHDVVAMTLDGVVTGLSQNLSDQTWITLLDPYSGEAVRQAAVDEKGHFAIGNISNEGNFILVVCQHDRVLAAQPVQFGRTFAGATVAGLKLPDGTVTGPKLAEGIFDRTLKVRIDVEAPKPSGSVGSTSTKLTASHASPARVFTVLWTGGLAAILAGGMVWLIRKRNHRSA